MSLRNVLSIICLAVVCSSSVSAEELTLDPKASKINFVGSKTDGKHEGGFKKFTCKAVADFENPENGSLSIEIDAASLWSDNGKLTNHLKNPDFFDVRKHKTIKFETTKIVHNDFDQSLTMIGKMTMLGKAVEVEIPAKYVMEGNALTLKANFDLDRTKWGMNYGEGKINKDVKIATVLVFNL